MKHSQAAKLAYHTERIRLALSPCPGRTSAERDFITRRVTDIADTLDYHLAVLGDSEPEWLPEAVITASTDQDYVESREAFEESERDDDLYITDMHNHNQRATNRVRIASWYKNSEANLYMTAMVAVSPLPCETWGALPLTLTQWRTIINQITLTHMRWKWVHAVRKYMTDTSYQIGGSFGWYMEPCKQLTKDKSELWTGQALYAHVTRKYSDHVQEA